MLKDGTSIDIGAWLRENAGSVKSTDSTKNADIINNVIRITFENIDRGCGIGRDYRDGRVAIVGTQYDNAIPASTIDHGREGVIRISLAGIPAERLKGARLRACVGVDAFAGDESQKRKTYVVRTKGIKARFVTVVEPYEGSAAVSGVIAVDENQVKVVLKDGCVQTVGISGMEQADGSMVHICMHRSGQEE